MKLTTDYIVYQNRKNGRYGYSIKEYAYNSATFLNNRTVFLETSFLIAYEIVEVMNSAIDDKKTVYSIL